MSRARVDGHIGRLRSASAEGGEMDGVRTPMVRWRSARDASSASSTPNHERRRSARMARARIVAGSHPRGPEAQRSFASEGGSVDKS